MILVDTSVWVGHLRHGNVRLAELLDTSQVLIHPFVIGELACGQLRARREILTLLQDLPRATPATHDEALHFLDVRRLHGRGLGWIDVHLLAAAALSRVPLWTLDRRLAAAHAEVTRQ